MPSLGATLQMTDHAKRRVAGTMYAKGKSFFAAAILLKRAGDKAPAFEGLEYVYLHLLCQSIEITLKGLLLLRDYEKYVTRLKKPLGHDLEKIVAEVIAAYGLKPMRPAIANELRALRNLYTRHWLRYASGYDLLVNPNTIDRDRVFLRLAAAVRLTERELRKVAP